ncbi:MAG TPA: hypothetical protein VH185_04445 [Mycobacterium sp.]|nr:hypothetical protein [Mycobacterium sp.]
MKTKLLAAIGGGAVIASALIVAVTYDTGQAIAGSGNGSSANTFSQPTQGAMTFGSTATAGPAATTLATSVASPTAKATQLGSECAMGGLCP